METLCILSCGFENRKYGKCQSIYHEFKTEIDIIFLAYDIFGLLNLVVDECIRDGAVD